MQLDALLAENPPLTVDVVTAGAALGLSAWSSYDLARRDAFPVPVLKAGRRYRVPTAPLLRALGLAPGRDEGPVAAGPTSTSDSFASTATSATEGASP